MNASWQTVATLFLSTDQLAAGNAPQLTPALYCGPCPLAPAVDPASGNVLVPILNGSNLTLIANRTFAASQSTQVPVAPTTVAWLSREKEWVVGSEGTGTVTWLASNLTVVRTNVLPVLDWPVATAYDPVQDRLFVVTYGSSFEVSCCAVVVVYNASSGALVTTLNLTGSEAFGNWGPGGIVYDPLTGLVYVQSVFSEYPIGAPSVSIYLTAIDPTNDSILLNRAIGGKSFNYYWTNSSGLAVDPTNGDLIVSSPDTRSDVAVLDPLTFRDLANISTGPAPAAAIVPPGGETILIPDANSDSLTVINATTLALEPPVSVGTWPTGGVYDPANGYVYVVDQGSDAVSILRLQSPLTIVGFNALPSNVTVGAPVAFDLSTSGGDPPMAYTYAGLPSGCTAGSGPDWICNASAAGNYTVYVTVTDFFGHWANGFTKLEVSAPESRPTPAIPPSPPGPAPGLWIDLLVAGGFVIGLVAGTATLVTYSARRARRPPDD